MDQAAVDNAATELLVCTELASRLKSRERELVLERERAITERREADAKLVEEELAYLKLDIDRTALRRAGFARDLDAARKSVG